MERQHTPWVLVAQSRSGSTWFNHVLASHPCVVSANELLMSNATARRLFQGSSDQIKRVLADIVQRTRDQARRGNCTSTAGGVKLKLAERDVTFGSTGNSGRVVTAMFDLGWRVILLERTNFLDHFLAFASRQATGVLHCSSHQECNRSLLNSSLRVECEGAKHSIDRLRLRSRVTHLLFEPHRNDSRFLQVEYERLVRRPADWLKLLSFIGMPASDACLLHDDTAKRILQTQYAQWVSTSASP